MKIGIRKPSPERSIKARTTGRVKRKVKSTVNPLYGKRGMGYIRNPERAVKNKIYHKLTIDPLGFIKKKFRRRSKMTEMDMINYPRTSKVFAFWMGFFYVLGILFAASIESTFLLYRSFNLPCTIGAVVCFGLFVLFYKRKYE